ncbi:MAG: phage tail protein, partial [Crocinitomicaceae bacterium]
MANYKTPGVYIEEISKFPPSVAQVETAIPAFIGYTQKAERLNGDSLNLDPTRVTSLLEYETYFGVAKSETIKVDIDDTTDDDGAVTNRSVKVHQPDPSVKSPFLMYYSMQMYFANGGGPCYIVSVGEYGDDVPPADKKTVVLKGDLDAGLAKVRKEDEPTLLLYPDAINLSGTVDDFYALYDSALTQCADLQDRFTIIDLQSDDETSDPTPVDTFRTKIPNDQYKLKYGAAYYPYLETILNYQFDAETVEISHTTTSPNAVPYALGVLKSIEDAVGADPLPITISRNLDDLVEAIRTGTIDASATEGGSLEKLEKFMIETFDIHGELADPVPGSGPKDLTQANRDLMLPLLVTAMEDLKELVDLKNHIVDHAESVAASITENAGQKTAVEAALKAFIDQFNGTSEDIELVHDALIPLHEKLVKDNSDTKVKNTISAGASNIHAEIEKLLDIGGSTAAATLPYAYGTNV